MFKVSKQNYLNLWDVLFLVPLTVHERRTNINDGRGPNPLAPTNINKFISMKAQILQFSVLELGNGLEVTVFLLCLPNGCIVHIIIITS